ncbi:MAG: ROK family protein, partial [Chloroflexota bacterium]
MSGYLAIDFGGTQLRAAWYDMTMHQVQREQTFSRVHQPQSDVLTRIIDTAQAVIPPGEKPVAIGVAAPGPLDAPNGVILHAETLPGWRNVPIGETISNAFDGAPTFVQNDGNLGAMAEARVGAAAQSDPAIYLTLSTGIGGGIIIDGKLFTGYDGLAAEPGHQLMALPDGTIKKLEMLASGTALGRIATDRLSTTPGIMTSLRDKGIITGADVGRAAASGDAFALEIVHDAMGWLGLGLVNLLHLFNPQIIVLGGALTQLESLLWDRIQQVV